MQNRLILSLAATALLSLPSAAFATTVTIASNPSNTDNGNFGAPDADAAVGYTISISDNGTSYIVVLSSTDPASAASPFANLYFDTIAGTPGTGSNLGFETTNDRAFIPGVPGYTDLASITGYSAVVTPDGSGKTITVTIPNSFFLTDPLGMGFTPTTPGGEVSLHLSQSFGLGVVGGAANFPGTGPDGSLIELGEAAVTAAPVPEPAGLTYMALSGFGLLAEAGRRLRGRRNA